MIKNRGIVQLGAGVEPTAQDSIVLIDAYDDAERQRAHQLMTEDWQLISMTRRRSADGGYYTEYRLLAPRQA